MFNKFFSGELVVYDDNVYSVINAKRNRVEIIKTSPFDANEVEGDSVIVGRVNYGLISKVKRDDAICMLLKKGVSIKKRRKTAAGKLIKW